MQYAPGESACRGRANCAGSRRCESMPGERRSAQAAGGRSSARHFVVFPLQSIRAPRHLDADGCRLEVHLIFHSPPFRPRTRNVGSPGKMEDWAKNGPVSFSRILLIFHVRPAQARGTRTVERRIELRLPLERRLFDVESDFGVIPELGLRSDGGKHDLESLVVSLWWVHFDAVGRGLRHHAREPDRQR